jgi:hypothetical protein
MMAWTCARFWSASRKSCPCVPPAFLSQRVEVLLEALLDSARVTVKRCSRVVTAFGVGQSLPDSGGRLPFLGRACPSGAEVDLLGRVVPNRGKTCPCGAERALVGQPLPFAGSGCPIRGGRHPRILSRQRHRADERRVGGSEAVKKSIRRTAGLRRDAQLGRLPRSPTASASPQARDALLLEALRRPGVGGTEKPVVAAGRLYPSLPLSTARLWQGRFLHSLSAQGRRDRAGPNRAIVAGRQSACAFRTAVEPTAAPQLL